tara:strand:- start:116 stop:913 length:798 start_codon:yes stop_codon:yes gene_type:complete
MFAAEEMDSAIRRIEELNSDHPYIRNAIGTGHHVDDQHLKEFRACYYGMIAELDDNLGIVFDTLEKTGQWEDTLIVFSADHGEQLGDHYLVGKGHFYDGAMHIPCIIRDPSNKAAHTRGTVVDHFVESIDLGPTVLDWLDVDSPDRFQGKSLLGSLYGEDDFEFKEEIHYEFDYRSSARAIDSDTEMDKHLLWVLRTKKFKYVHFADDKIPSLLFNLEEDPEEFENIAQDPKYSSIVMDLMNRMLVWRMRCEDQRMENWASQFRY